MIISTVVAMNSKYLIGINNDLPWRLKDDLEHFKNYTLNKPIIMGRKTFESIGRVLPNRFNVIVSSTLSNIKKAEIVKNLDSLKTYNIGKKYEILDKIFLKVLKQNAQRMPNIFFEIFNSSSETSIKFLSNKSNIFQDLSIISKMPKWPFIKALFN